jgi:hypothetical protein
MAAMLNFLSSFSVVAPTGHRRGETHANQMLDYRLI